MKLKGLYISFATIILGLYMEKLRELPLEKRKNESFKRILKFLDEGSWITWSELYEKLKPTGMSRATLSRHLKEMEERGFIERRVDSLQYPPRVYYKIKGDPYDRAIKLAEDFEKIVEEVSDLKSLLIAWNIFSLFSNLEECLKDYFYSLEGDIIVAFDKLIFGPSLDEEGVSLEDVFHKLGEGEVLRSVENARRIVEYFKMIGAEEKVIKERERLLREFEEMMEKYKIEEKEEKLNEFVKRVKRLREKIERKSKEMRENILKILKGEERATEFEILLMNINEYIETIERTIKNVK